MNAPPDRPPLWRRDEPDSPCVRICVIHPEHGICIGCHRTAAEVAGWAALDARERAAIRAELPGRGAVLRVRRGGRGARLERG
ncbi:MAG: DUF1289 domain-containing protein [Rubellimicrobium sp.]|nr:DUF1289 domain-containing protein [Rubellimicrobium sp.]